MLKIKKEDEVVVIAGRDKGRRGEVMRVMKDGRLLIAGVNMVKKHTRANPNTGEKGGIVDKESPIQVSNVAIWTHDELRHTNEWYTMVGVSFVKCDLEENGYGRTIIIIRYCNYEKNNNDEQ